MKSDFEHRTEDAVSLTPRRTFILKRRLASTRWPEHETVGDWTQGVPLGKAKALVAYWRER